MEINSNKPCLTCKHFRKHYAKENGYFRFLERGICKARRFSVKQQAQLPYINNCDMWEKDDVKLREDKTVKAVVEEIKTRLDNLLEVITYKEYEE